MQTAGMQSPGSSAKSTASPASPAAAVPEAAQTGPSAANGAALTPTSSSPEA